MHASTLRFVQFDNMFDLCHVAIPLYYGLEGVTGDTPATIEAASLMSARLSLAEVFVHVLQRMQ